ncbi:hypothetical protein P3S67_022581 [Capsicum chacoense]
MMKNKTSSCIIFENGFTILSFDGKIIERTQEIPSFCLSIPLTVVVLLDGVCGISGGGDRRRRGGISWWCSLWLSVVSIFMVFVLLALLDGVCGGGCWCVGIRGIYFVGIGWWCLWWWLVVFVVVAVGVSVVVVFVM